MMHKHTPLVYYNWLLNRLETELNEPTNQNSIKVPKVVLPTNNLTFHSKQTKNYPRPYSKLVLNIRDPGERGINVQPATCGKIHMNLL